MKNGSCNAIYYFVEKLTQKIDEKRQKQLTLLNLSKNVLVLYHISRRCDSKKYWNFRYFFLKILSLTRIVKLFGTWGSWVRPFQFSAQSSHFRFCFFFLRISSIVFGNKRKKKKEEDRHYKRHFHQNQMTSDSIR